MPSNVTPEQLVSTYLRGEGADVARAKTAARLAIEYDASGFCDLSDEYTAEARAHLVCAAIRIGFTFKARGKLAPACEYEGVAAIGGTEANDTDKDPWWCLVNFVEAAQ